MLIIVLLRVYNLFSIFTTLRLQLDGITGDLHPLWFGVRSCHNSGEAAFCNGIANSVGSLTTGHCTRSLCRIPVSIVPVPEGRAYVFFSIPTIEKVPMKKSMAYIKATGTLQYSGDRPAFSADYRLFENAVIVDAGHDEVGFQGLTISKEMDGLLDFERPMTFYILRYRAGEKATGVLYAAEADGKKIFRPCTAVPALKFLGLSARNRFPFIINPWAAILFIVIFGGVLSSALSLGNIISAEVAMGIGFGAAVFFLYTPLIFLARGADINQMYRLLRSDGFITESSDTRIR